MDFETCDPQIDQRQLLRGLLASEPEALEQLIVESKGTFSDEGLAAVRSGAWARKLMHDAAVRKTLAAMIAFRRSYVVAYRELQRLVAEERQRHPTLHTQTEDALVMSAMHQAALPFSEHELMQGYASSVLPWLATTIDQHVTQEVAEEQERQRTAEEERRARPVPLGHPGLRIDLDEETEAGVIRRDRSLVLAGHRSAC